MQQHSLPWFFFLCLPLELSFLYKTITTLTYFEKAMYVKKLSPQATWKPPIPMPKSH
jgi:hypothetical protein